MRESIAKSKMVFVNDAENFETKSQLCYVLHLNNQNFDIYVHPISMRVGSQRRFDRWYNIIEDQKKLSRVVLDEFVTEKV